MLNQRRGYSNDPFNLRIAAFLQEVLLGITGCDREVRVEISIAKAPTIRRKDRKPRVGRWISDMLARIFKGPIEQVTVRNVSASYPRSRKRCNTVVPYESPSRPEFG